MYIFNLSIYSIFRCIPIYLYHITFYLSTCKLTTTPQRLGLDPASLENIFTSLFGSKDSNPNSLPWNLIRVFPVLSTAKQVSHSKYVKVLQK